ncbi:MAG: GAF domain-containing protein [Caldilineaceae bacterium]
MRSDIQRDAERYNHLVNVLKRAANEVLTLATRSDTHIDELLTRLLPLFARALDAELAFAAKQLPSRHNNSYLFEINAISGRPSLVGERLALNRQQFGRLVNEGIAWLYPPTAETEPTIIAALSPLQAKSALIVRLDFLKQTYLIGVCNKKNLLADPFLAADKNALDSIVKLIVGGARLNEQHRRENEAIQRISEKAIQGNPEAVWLTIAQEITQLTGVRYTTLVQVDQARRSLSAVATWDSEVGRSPVPPWTLPLNEESMNGYAAIKGHSLYASDTSLHKRTTPFTEIDGYSTLGTRSAFCMPLRIGEETIGTIYIAGQMVDGISPENQQTVQRIAPLAAIALQNANLLNEAAKKRKIQQRVIEIQQSIADIRSWPEQLEQICTKLADYFDTEGIFLALFDPGSGYIEFPLIYEYGQKIEEQEKVFGTIFSPRRFGEEWGTVDWVIRAKETLRVDDFATWPNRDQIDEKFYASIRSCLLIPMQRGNQVTGVIGLRSYKRTYAYSEEDQMLMELLSSHISVVIDNAQVYEQRLRDLRAINKFQQKISALEVDQSNMSGIIEPGDIVDKELATIYPHAQDALHEIGIHTENLLIALFDEASESIRFALVYEQGQRLHKNEIEQLEYYRTRQLDERKDLVNWLIRGNRREPLLLSFNDFAGWHAEHPEVTTMPSRSQTFLGQALIYRDQLIGVLILRNPTQQDNFTTNHLGLISMIASQIAIVIGNAQLYELSRIQQRQVDRALNIAVMGAWEADIAHHVNAEASTIGRELYKLSRIPDALPPKVQEHLDTIQQSARRLELPELHLANPGFHAGVDAYDSYDRPLVDEVIESEVSRIKHDWTDDLEDAFLELKQGCAGVCAHMHELWLRRCLRHFVSNAIKSRALDRPLHIQIITQVANGIVHISVRDNGKGVDPEVARYLFKQPIPIRPERRHRSSGTGLALVGFVCERFQGTAQLVRSDPDQGSEFVFTTPVAHEL